MLLMFKSHASDSKFRSSFAFYFGILSNFLLFIVAIVFYSSRETEQKNFRLQQQISLIISLAAMISTMTVTSMVPLSTNALTLCCASLSFSYFDRFTKQTKYNNSLSVASSVTWDEERCVFVEDSVPEMFPHLKASLFVISLNVQLGNSSPPTRLT